MSSEGDWHLIDDTAAEFGYWPSDSWRAAEGEDSDVYNEGTFHSGRVSDGSGGIIYVWFQFRGTGLRIRGGPGGNGTCYLRLLQGNTFTPPEEEDFPCASSGDSAAQLYEVTDLEDTDHEAEVIVYSGGSQIDFDAIEIQSSHGNGFELENIGPNASSVPSDATTYDDSSPIIQFSSDWQRSTFESVRDYNGTSIASDQIGSWFSVVFEGTGIWWYGQGPLSTEYTIRLDDRPPENHFLIGMSAALQARSLAWNATGLEPTLHTLNVTKTDFGIGVVDFIRIAEVGSGASTVQQSSVSTASDSSTRTNVPDSTDTQPLGPGPSNPSSSNQEGRGLSGGAIGGIVVGILLFIVAVVIGVLLWKLRKRRQLKLIEPTTAEPYTLNPMNSSHPPYVIPAENEKPPFSTSFTAPSVTTQTMAYSPFVTTPSEKHTGAPWAPPSHPPTSHSQENSALVRPLPAVPPSEGDFYEDGRMHE